MKVACLLCLGLVLATLNAAAQKPEWIWTDHHGQPSSEHETAYFRKTFSVSQPVKRAVLTAAADDQAVLFVNGQRVLANRSWHSASSADVARQIHDGENLLAARARNDGGQSGLLARLELTFADGTKQVILSDRSWMASEHQHDGWDRTDFDATGWTAAVSLGAVGVQPWGDVLAPRTATLADKLTTLPGFKVELIRSAEPGEGSWVSMTIDPKGRLIISPQEGVRNMLRVTLSPEGEVANVETIDQPVGSAMGLLYALDSLYVSGAGPQGLGLYRLRDTDGDDHYDKLELLRKLDNAGGEHGSHGLLLGPDGKLYYVNGNFVKLPKDLSPESPHRHYAEDQLLPRGEDGNGFGVGLKPPGGFVLRMDPDGGHPELFAAGFRNTYDIAFNPDGELFGFDSDMEWDWGMPWYRPIRINHIVSGGDYGFREGTGKFPIYYPDTLPTTLNIGVGSPTGVKFGTKSNFPPEYKKAFFAMDWSYGRILAVHLHPQGSTYAGTFENFVAPASLHSNGPKSTLNLTDLEFGQDGAMYFMTGGRGTQSGLYRVSYVGPAAPASTSETDAAADEAGAKARAIRHQLERFDGKEDPGAIDFAWPYLDSPDRWLRYAARIAIESQPVEQWQERALKEERPNAGLTALLALARLGPASVQKDLLTALDNLPTDQFTEEQNLAALRVIELAFIRMGRPSDELAQATIDRLDPLYPAKDWLINRELSQILIYLRAPDVVAKTLALLESAPTQEQQIHYIFHLRTLKTGWTLAQRRQYLNWFDRDWNHGAHSAEELKWFADAGRDYDNGASFPRFMAYFRKDAIASLSAEERTALASVIDRLPMPMAQATAPQRAFVKDWKVDDLLPLLDEVSASRDLARGKQTFANAQCIACHRFGNEGGSVGPDLTAVRSRYTRRDILESMLLPSKVVSEQYQNTTVFKKDGDDVTGRLVEDSDQKLVLVVNPLTQERVEVSKSDVRSTAASKISPMPEGLLNTFSKDEILDLIAYLESAGHTQAQIQATNK